MRRKQVLIFIVFIISTFMLFGDTNSEKTTVDYSINWKDQQLVIVLKNIFPDTTKPLPSIKSNTEMAIKKNLNYIFLKGIEQITIDSKLDGANFIKKHPSIIGHIFDIVPSLIKEHSLFAPDFKSLSTKYTLNLYPDIVALFIQHSRTSTVAPILDFVPSADFTGIVIYVDDSLPMYGKHNKGIFSPSLFPKIFDEELNLVISPIMIDPEVILKVGTVGYQYLSDSLNLERIGLSPFKLKARKIFGINNTDLIISSRDADKILSRQNNINLISQGKILIIYNNIK